MAFAQTSSQGDVVSPVVDAALENVHPILQPKGDNNKLINEGKTPENAVVSDERPADSACSTKASIEIPKDLTQVNATKGAPVCCYSPASTGYEVVTPMSKDQNSNDNASGKHLPLKSQRESMCTSGVKDDSPKALVKEYQVNNTSGALESLVKEVYDAEGRMIWYKIITGTRKSPGRSMQEGDSSSSGSLCGGCRKLAQSSHEGDAARKGASNPSSAVREKPESCKSLTKRVVATEEGGRAEEPEKKSKKGKVSVSVPAKGESSLEPSTTKSVATGAKQGITRTVLRFLGEFEDATIKSNRMREKNVLGSHHDMVKLFLIAQGFFILAFVFLAIVLVNVAALLFIVLFGTR